jgi:hypothetical protein
LQEKFKNSENMVKVIKCLKKLKIFKKKVRTF